ncbi:XdhC family protein [Roseibium sp. RKSG952]|uniref:XdhC family protein n=1 Tax=Roseibium sp. RKSG952 TaxID=2529384 RepID=UPI001AD8B43A|nr:XdhC family protein [Roseibium sp. RKSG952]
MRHTDPAADAPHAPVLPNSLPDLTKHLQEAHHPYVLATVVRTISVTAAKAGAKAVILKDGTIQGGWIGGGCARAAVIKAAQAALIDGETRLVSIQPEDLLAEHGVAPGDVREGVQFAKNMCPSQGTMDIFIEPVLPRPELVIFGASPVALALSALAPAIGFDCIACAPPEDHWLFQNKHTVIPGYDAVPESNALRFLVVSTQGKGDLAALAAALPLASRYLAFVGSRRKTEALCKKLKDAGHTPDVLDRIKGPAGLDLGAITPEEIALSILAELLKVRRQDQRQALETTDSQKTRERTS